MCLCVLHTLLQVVEETEELIKISGEGDATKELFPLKMRDAAQAAGFAYIKSKGLIPDEDSDDYIPVSIVVLLLVEVVSLYCVMCMAAMLTPCPRHLFGVGGRGGEGKSKGSTCGVLWRVVLCCVVWWVMMINQLIPALCSWRQRHCCPVVRTTYDGS